MSETCILITGVGDPGLIYVLKSLKGKYKTVACDMDRFAAGLYFANSAYVVLACTDKKYPRQLEKIIKDEKVDIIIPTIDEELVQMAEFSKRKPHPKVLIANVDFVKMCLDKWILSSHLKDANIPYAKTVLVSDLKQIPANLFPCIVKPRAGRGGRGLAKIKSRDELLKYLKNTKYKRDELVMQEFLDGVEYTVSVVVNKVNDLLAVVPKEVVIKEGITKIGITKENKQIKDLSVKIVKSFDACGPFNIQLIFNEKTKMATIFEINPRFSTTVALTVESGVDEVAMLIADRLGKRFQKPRAFKKDLVMIRYPEQLYIRESSLK